MQQTNSQEILVRSLLRYYNLDKLNFANLDKLSQLIKSNDQGSISGNTLARIAGLRSDKRKTFDFNLDTLCKIIGLGTYQNFERFIAQKSNVGINNIKEDAEDFISSYTIEAAQNNDLKFLASVEKYIERKGVGMTNFFNIGNALMIGCRSNKNPKKIIDFSIESPILTQLFYETYVDLDYLNGYFGEAMIALSKLNTSNNSTYLFSNSIAYLCERSRNKVLSFKKRGSELLEMNTGFINTIANDRYIYPVARWLRVCIDFSLLNSNARKSNELFEFSLLLINQLSSDDAVIIISEISEIDNRILPPEYLLKLKELLILKCNHINYEYDCYLNAALNISIKLGCKDLISHSQAKNFFSNHPRKFVTRSNTILNKINSLFH